MRRFLALLAASAILASLFYSLPASAQDENEEVENEAVEEEQVEAASPTTEYYEVVYGNTTGTEVCKVLYFLLLQHLECNYPLFF